MKTHAALILTMILAGLAHSAETGMEVVAIGTIPGYVRNLCTTSLVDEEGREKDYRFWDEPPYVPALENRSVTVTPTYENGEIVQVEIVPN